MPRDLEGYRALGRHGPLGVVVDSPMGVAHGPSEIVVRGGVSQALLFYVPPERLLVIRPGDRTVVFDVDLADFVPSLHDDGWVELRVSLR